MNSNQNNSTKKKINGCMSERIHTYTTTKISSARMHFIYKNTNAVATADPLRNKSIMQQTFLDLAFLALHTLLLV